MIRGVFEALGEELRLVTPTSPEGLSLRGRLWPCSLQGQGTGWEPSGPGLAPGATFRLLAAGEGLSEDTRGMELRWRGRYFRVLWAEPVVLDDREQYWRCLLLETGGVARV